MGVEPFLLSSSLIGVLAQRLVRLLCAQCKEAYTPSETEYHALGLSTETPLELFRATGCEMCNGQGYRGRTGIYELIPVDDELRTMIHDGAGEQQLEEYARSKTPGIRQDGVRRIRAGDTSLEEVLRVTREE